MTDSLNSHTAKKKVHAFDTDILRDHDATALAQMVRNKEITAQELLSAAIDRVEKVNPQLNATIVKDYENALKRAKPYADGLFAGIPTFIKDNTDLEGLPSCHGSLAVNSSLIRGNGLFTRQYLSMGFAPLGKTRLPEFGLNCTTEFEKAEPAVNPWNTAYSCGGSSGGSAALVASGAVPIAHANDGGGSIRIPAACCGLLGLKSTRGRLVDGKMAKSMPLNLISEGVVTRTVRDTANFIHGAELYWKNKKLPPIGHVEGPSSHKMKIALVTDSILDNTVDDETVAAVQRTARLLEGHGHIIEEAQVPFDASFADDFARYWAFLAWSIRHFGRFTFGKGFDGKKVDSLTEGLAKRFGKKKRAFPGMMRRLSRTKKTYAAFMETYDLVLTPVLGHTVPETGYLNPKVPFEELFTRMMYYVCFTPLNNAAGSPAITVPAGLDEKGLPLAVHFMAAHGNERALIEMAYLLEAEQPFPQINK